jgi:hypothetical protein
MWRAERKTDFQRKDSAHQIGGGGEGGGAAHPLTLRYCPDTRSDPPSLLPLYMLYIYICTVTL